jgi:hypothetical protein
MIPLLNASQMLGFVGVCCVDMFYEILSMKIHVISKEIKKS